MANGDRVTSNPITINTNTKHVVVAVVSVVTICFSLFLFLRSEWRSDIATMAYAKEDGVELRVEAKATKAMLIRIERKFDMAINAMLPQRPIQEK